MQSWVIEKVYYAPDWSNTEVLAVATTKEVAKRWIENNRPRYALKRELRCELYYERDDFTSRGGGETITVSLFQMVYE